MNKKRIEMVKKGFVKPRIMKKSCSETKYKRITSTTYQSFYATGNILQLEHRECLALGQVETKTLQSRRKIDTVGTTPPTFRVLNVLSGRTPCRLTEATTVKM